MANCNIKNRTIFCSDNLEILEGINSNSIDLIYLDPPFNKDKEFTAPIGSSAEGASFKDIFREEDVKDEWIETIKEDYDGIYHFLTNVKNLSSVQINKNKHYLYNYCYLCYMAIRLIEMHRILKDTGSIYLHCDPTMSHYLKILMDLIFGENNFKNEIVWHYFMGGKAKKLFFARKHDYLIFYSKSEKNYFQKQLHKRRLDFKPALSNPYEKNRIGKDEFGYYSIVTMDDVWDIRSVFNLSKEYNGYPTQKPLKLLERIIKTSSNEGDLVLDPFCGCATTCIASEKFNRKWIGIDVSIEAYNLVKKRLEKEVYPDLFDDKIITFSTTPPIRTDKNGFEKEKKWVYVISNENYQDEFKVGIASNYQQRLNSYQTSDPNRAYKIEYKLHTQNFREIEKHIHDKFENRHEWVRAGLDNIIKEIKNYEK